MNALLIGRFQPFHNGHLHLIQNLSKTYNEVIIGVGSSQYSHTAENPFSYNERHEMIARSLTDAGITNYRIVAIPDIHDPPHWVDHVLSYVNDFDVVISNNPETCRLFTAKGYTVQRTVLFKRVQYSGQEVRRRLASGGRWTSLVPAAVAAIIREVHGQERLAA
jgi:nicotinamide-nucleotide adenylyltransferase